MRREERRVAIILLRLAVVGVIGAALLPIAVYQFGLWVAPPRPVPQAANAPQLLLDALWARAEGGRADALRPITPISLAQLAACVAMAEGRNDNERIDHCRHVMPGLPGVEYLATLHLQDSGVERNSFRGGHGQFATVVWMTRSWSKEDFVNTLAARGRFGNGWRGVEAAARGLFGREAAALTLAQVAVVASRVGDSNADPWCEPEAAGAMRDRILGRMLENGIIDHASFERARAEPLGLATPPGNRPPCKK